MAKKIRVVTSKKGNRVRLMNPQERANKAAYELKTGVRVTNFGEVKRDRNGKPMRLTKTQRAFRSGVLSQQKASRRAYNAKKRRRYQ